jgi:hypothetical protein
MTLLDVITGIIGMDLDTFMTFGMDLIAVTRSMDLQTLMMFGMGLTAVTLRVLGII